ncbi:MAG TPA: L,D-transpeptidase family protein [Luteibacter sp.]|uniref:L,D-transpeptidase family protein n=1 Tax=Luteibacter sp. TaxID=1886636 RepID=UPI002BA4EFC3|nr:L,D-transpeptidase family protein [Luteibacter sp.]HVI55097.1 L,D-transpeptidase family protein [Luteibacter sp.]
MPSPRTLGRLLALAGILLTASSGAFETPAAWSVSRQMVVVTTDGWDADHGILRTYVREGTQWKPQGPATDVTIGTHGSAWGVGLNPPEHDGPVKKEGDGRSPAGVFRIGDAFGYAQTHATALPYRALTVSDYCVDVDGSPYYNQLVDATKVGEKAVAGATEPMRRDLHFDGDHAYRIGFVIEHNPDGRKGAGSCIFAHVWKSPTSPTAGCTAMTDAAMERLLGWLDPKKKPVFVLLPASEYARLREAWNLPAP